MDEIRDVVRTADKRVRLVGDVGTQKNCSVFVHQILHEIMVGEASLERAVRED